MNRAEELRNAFWQEDAARGGIIRTQYDEIKRVLLEEDVDWVAERLCEIKEHAIRHTEFYRDLSLDAEFPVLNKLAILAHYDAHAASGGFSLPIHKSSTSGSTGTPFTVLQDYKKRMRNIADLQVFGELCDYPPRERMVFFRVLSEKLKRTPEQEERENIFYVDSSDLGAAHLEEMYQVVVERKPQTLFSYSSTLVTLAKYIAEHHKDAHFYLKSVLMAGEGIAEEDRKMLEDVFGCPAYRRYSDMELGVLGQDMGDGGAYTLNFGSYYIECLKMDEDIPAKDGEVGRIVITDLFNYAFPMIRYDTGDLGVMETQKGKRFPVLKEIYGRKRDCVYKTDGSLLSPAKISITMWGIEGISQWQFVQKTETEYVMRLNGDASVDTLPLIRKMTEILGDGAKLSIEWVNEIPVLSSNKRRAIICELKKD